MSCWGTLLSKAILHLKLIDGDPHMNRKSIIAVLFAGNFLAISPSIAENNCNCLVIESRCSADISFNKPAGIATITTSAQSCARVVFDIDSTPYTSVFNGGRTTENVTIFQKDKPVSAAIRSCEMCQITGQNGSRQSSEDSQSQSLASFLAGNWQYSAPRTSFVFRFGSNASGTLSATNNHATNGTISCTGTPDNFTCQQDATTLLENGPHVTHASDNWRKTSATSFSHQSQGGVVFNKF
jgi:hypothetical protein